MATSEMLQVVQEGTKMAQELAYDTSLAEASSSKDEPGKDGDVETENRDEPAETFSFSFNVDIGEMMSLNISAIYTSEDIFFREMSHNTNDALDKIPNQRDNKGLTARSTGVGLQDESSNQYNNDDNNTSNNTSTSNSIDNSIGSTSNGMSFVGCNSYLALKRTDFGMSLITESGVHDANDIFLQELISQASERNIIILTYTMKISNIIASIFSTVNCFLCLIET